VSTYAAQVVIKSGVHDVAIVGEKQVAKDFLDTREGELFWRRIFEADMLASTADIDSRAIN